MHVASIVDTEFDSFFLLNLLVCRGYKVGRSKDEKINDAIYLIKYLFCITLITLLLVLLGVFITFGMTIILIIYIS